MNSDGLLRGDLLAVAMLRPGRARITVLEGTEVRIWGLPIVLGTSGLCPDCHHGDCRA